MNAHWYGKSGQHDCRGNSKFNDSWLLVCTLSSTIESLQMIKMQVAVDSYPRSFHKVWIGRGSKGVMIYLQLCFTLEQNSDWPVKGQLLEATDIKAYTIAFAYSVIYLHVAHFDQSRFLLFSRCMHVLYYYWYIVIATIKKASNKVFSSLVNCLIRD